MAIENKYPRTIASVVQLDDNRHLEELYKSTSQEWTIDNFATGGYIDNSGTSVTIDSSAHFGYKVASDVHWAHIVIDVNDLYTGWIISANGGSSARMWAWIDENNNIISVCPSTTGSYVGVSSSIPDVIYPPTGAKKLIVNNRLTDNSGSSVWPNPKVTCFKVGMENTNIETKTYFTTCSGIKSITVGGTTTKYSVIPVPKNFKLVPGVTINVLFKQSGFRQAFLVGSDYVDDTTVYKLTYGKNNTVWDGYSDTGGILSLTYNGVSLHVTGGKDSTFANNSFGNTNGWANTKKNNSSGQSVVWASTATADGGDNSAPSQCGSNRARMVVKFNVDVAAGEYLMCGNTFDESYDYPIYYRDELIKDDIIKTGDICVLTLRSSRWHLLSNDRWGEECPTATHLKSRSWSFDCCKGMAVFAANHDYNTNTNEGVSLPTGSTATTAYVVANSAGCAATICARNADNMIYSTSAAVGTNVMFSVALQSPDEEFDLYVEDNESQTTLSYFITDSQDVAEAVLNYKVVFPSDCDPYKVMSAQVGDVFVLGAPYKIDAFTNILQGESFVCVKDFSSATLTIDNVTDYLYFYDYIKPELRKIQIRCEDTGNSTSNSFSVTATNWDSPMASVYTADLPINIEQYANQDIVFAFDTDGWSDQATDLQWRAESVYGKINELSFNTDAINATGDTYYFELQYDSSEGITHMTLVRAAVESDDEMKSIKTSHGGSIPDNAVFRNSADITRRYVKSRGVWYTETVTKELLQ